MRPVDRLRLLLLCMRMSYGPQPWIRPTLEWLDTMALQEAARVSR